MGRELVPLGKPRKRWRRPSGPVWTGFAVVVGVVAAFVFLVLLYRLLSAIGLGAALRETPTYEMNMHGAEYEAGGLTSTKAAGMFAAMVVGWIVGKVIAAGAFYLRKQEGRRAFLLVKWTIGCTFAFAVIDGLLPLGTFWNILALASQILIGCLAFGLANERWNAIPRDDGLEAEA